MVSFSRLMKEPLFLTDMSRRLCMASSREMLKSNLKKRRSRWCKNLSNLQPCSAIHGDHLFLANHWRFWKPEIGLWWKPLPLIELWIKVSLFDTGLSFGASVLVRLQDEGHIRVWAVLGAWRQLSTWEGEKKKKALFIRLPPPTAMTNNNTFYKTQGCKAT